MWSYPRRHGCLGHILQEYGFFLAIRFTIQSTRMAILCILMLTIGVTRSNISNARTPALKRFTGLLQGVTDINISRSFAPRFDFSSEMEVDSPEDMLMVPHIDDL